MSNLFKAHIFKTRQVGEREEVKLRMFRADGTPLEIVEPVEPEEPEEPAEPQSAWVIAQHTGTLNLDANSGSPAENYAGLYPIGPALEFETPASGMGLFIFTAHIWQPPSSHNGALVVDEDPDLRTEMFNFSNGSEMTYSLWVGGAGGRLGNFFNHGGVITRAGVAPVVLRLSPGAHKIQYAYGSAGGGGFYKDPFFAYLPLG